MAESAIIEAIIAFSFLFLRYGKHKTLTNGVDARRVRIARAKPDITAVVSFIEMRIGTNSP
jgi:hypothetical protein